MGDPDERAVCNVLYHESLSLHLVVESLCMLLIVRVSAVSYFYLP